MEYFSTIGAFIRRIYFQLFDKFVLYPLMVTLPKQLNLKFLNLGYLPISWMKMKNELPDATVDADDKNIIKVIEQHMNLNDSTVAHCFLYEKALSFCPLYPRFRNKVLLEVGCGLGGGIEWLKCAHKELSKVVGVDKVKSGTNDDILVGNAEQLPFASLTFDIVLNVESSHLYSSMSQFLAEVYRVLRPEGYFCWADLRHKGQMEAVMEECERTGFNLIHFKIVTPQIVEGLRYTSLQYDNMLEKAPWFIKLLRTTLRETYCAPGTTTFKQYENGERQYAIGCWKKPKY